MVEKKGDQPWKSFQRTTAFRTASRGVFSDIAAPVPLAIDMDRRHPRCSSKNRLQVVVGLFFAGQDWHPGVQRSRISTDMTAITPFVQARQVTWTLLLLNWSVGGLGLVFRYLAGENRLPNLLPAPCMPKGTVNRDPGLAMVYATQLVPCGYGPASGLRKDL